MICSNLANVSLFLSSSQAAVTDTTSGLMLFSCSSNCSLNKMAWSRGINRFTPDIWKKKRGAYETIPCLLLQWVCDSVCVRARVWEHAVVGKCSEFIYYRNLQLNKAPLFNSMRTFCVSNLLTNHLRKRTISTLFTTHTDTTTSLWLVSFKSADNSTITILWKRSVYFFPALSFAHVYASFLTTTPNCSDSAKSSYSSFISARTPSWSGPGSCLIRF